MDKSDLRIENDLLSYYTELQIKRIKLSCNTVSK